jgi:hypothetical protein
MEASPGLTMTTSLPASSSKESSHWAMASI